MRILRVSEFEESCVVLDDSKDGPLILRCVSLLKMVTLHEEVALILLINLDEMLERDELRVAFE